MRNLFSGVGRSLNPAVLPSMGNETTGQRDGTGSTFPMLLKVYCIGPEIYWSFFTSVFTTPGGKEKIILQYCSLQAEYSKPLLYQVVALLNTVFSSDMWHMFQLLSN